MKRIHFAVDGPRDGATLPHIVANVLKIEVEPVIYEWKNIRLNKGKGYPDKLSYALRQAKDADADGLVAVVDRDKDEKRARLKKLQVAREADREKNSAFPIALGEADPHGEAWLLDAPHAIRKALEVAPKSRSRL